MNENEIRILEEIAKGNGNAYEGIIDKYSKKIYSFIYSLVRDSHIAEELTQETFIKVYWNLNKFDKNKELSVWMYKIARNTVLDHLRKANKQNTLELDESITVSSEVGKAGNPAEILERKEKLSVVGAVIDGLPVKYKELVILKYFEGLSYFEIAARLDISQDKVKWSLHQARKKMAGEYERYQLEEEGGMKYGL